MKNKLLVLLFVLTLWTRIGYADGLSPMELKKVIPQINTVLLVKIIDKAQNIENIKTGKGKAVKCNYKFKVKILEVIKGKFNKKELDFKYTFTVVKGVWLSYPGSGIEDNMKKGEKYIFLYKENNNNAIQTLIRAEKESNKKKIKELLTLFKKKSVTN
jgi:hypothetical protein